MSKNKWSGISLAATSAVMIGLTPVFGKQAIQAGLPPLAVVAARTTGAALLILLLVLVVNRRYLYIYPVGLGGCFLAGSINGIGSLLFYSSLARIDASLAQLLFSFYPIFVALVLYFDGLRYRPVTLLRLGLSLPAVYLLLQASTQNIDWLGVSFALCAGLLYALHIPINQRVLYEVPAPTVTLYTLLAMTAVVVPAYLLLSPHVPISAVSSAAWTPLLSLTVATFLSRITLFAGVKSIGGLQTALIGLSELLVTVALGILWLGETLTTAQWIGAGLLFCLLTLAGFEEPITHQPRGHGWLHWLLPPLPSAHKPATPPDHEQS